MLNFSYLIILEKIARKNEDEAHGMGADGGGGLIHIYSSRINSCVNKVYRKILRQNKNHTHHMFYTL